ncbi:5-methylaminomethyl-2-thiouridylate-methyltransferase [Globomyces pollinis-pini]|nr:5-methylaminomethyl-2-thiouridylate-methyltransferase [Globomyces pollinis-pini]
MLKRLIHSHSSSISKGPIVVGMSGGVDSSVSALLLKKMGYDVLGVYMRNWDNRDENGVCPSEQDWMDVKQTCDKLKIPCEQVDLSKEYWTMVFDPFLDLLASGATPNPDVGCNQFIKFGAFLEKCKDLYQINQIAFGHYAQKQTKLESLDCQLLKAIDQTKDQTYYLSQISQQSLQKTIFPIGHLLKSQVKEIARLNGLEKISSKRESMGICFIGKRPFGSFVSEYIQQTPGHIVTLEGEIVGTHQGLSSFTIGQNARISGSTNKWFIAHKDVHRNQMVVVPSGNHIALQRRVIFSSIHWINQRPKSKNMHVKFRYRTESKPAIVEVDDEGVKVEFKESQIGLTVGQTIAIYDGNVCLGGGVVHKLGRWDYEGSEDIIPKNL